MAKGFILVDMPKSCFYCDYCHEKEYNRNYQIEGNKFCGLENMEVNDFYSYENLRRPDWCPIRELPDFQEVANNISQSTPVKFAHEMMNLGWNKCLENILGKINL